VDFKKNPLKTKKPLKKTYILGRIFSNCCDFDEEIIEESRKKEICENLTEENIGNMKKELEELEMKSQKRLDNYQKRNKRYKELLTEFFLLKIS